MKFNTDLIDGKTVFVVDDVERLKRLLQNTKRGDLDIKVDIPSIEWAIETYADPMELYMKKGEYTMAIRPEICDDCSYVYIYVSFVGFYRKNGFTILDFDDMFIDEYEIDGFATSDMDISMFM